MNARPTLVKIPGTDVWVNPAYVTSVQQIATPYGTVKTVTQVEYEGNAGYRTRTTSTLAAVSEVVQAINGSPDELVQP